MIQCEKVAQQFGCVWLLYIEGKELLLRQRDNIHSAHTFTYVRNTGKLLNRAVFSHYYTYVLCQKHR